jgi:hypothetical protein
LESLYMPLQTYNIYDRNPNVSNDVFAANDT